MRAATLFVIALSGCTIASAGQAGRHLPPEPSQKALPSLSAEEVFKRVSPSVMVVESLDADGKATTLGSGVVVAPGLVITNRHVIKGGVSFRVEHDGRKWPARLVRVDPDHDLAELSVAGLSASPVKLRDSSKLAVGEKVYAIGSPEGLELTISEGLISGLRDFDGEPVVQTSAAISPGSSGGGLFDTEGRLVGITTFYLKEGQSLNFALPAEWAVALNRQPATAPPAATGKSGPAFQSLVWFEVGYKAVEAGKYDVAADAFKRAVKLRPDSEEAWCNLGFAYRHLGLNERAINAEVAAIQLKPDDEDAWDNLGKAYNALRQYDKAIMAEEEAVRLRPDLEDAWGSLGHAYDGLGQYDKAVSAEQEAIRLKPDDEVSWYNLGNVYLYDLRQYDKATNAEREAIRLKPDDANAWYNLGGAYGALGQNDKAINAEQEAIRLKPDDANAWYLLGLCLKAERQQSEVIEVYEKLKTLDPKLADEFFRQAVVP